MRSMINYVDNRPNTIYTYVNTHMHIYNYIYIKRERERCQASQMLSPQGCPKGLLKATTKLAPANTWINQTQIEGIPYTYVQYTHVYLQYNASTYRHCGQNELQCFAQWAFFYVWGGKFKYRNADGHNWLRYRVTIWSIAMMNLYTLLLQAYCLKYPLKGHLQHFPNQFSGWRRLLVRWNRWHQKAITQP